MVVGETQDSAHAYGLQLPEMQHLPGRDPVAQGSQDPLSGKGDP